MEGKSVPSMMDEQDVNSQFADWLASRWNHQGFEHSYIERGGPRAKSFSATEWRIRNMSEARDKYLWNRSTLAENETITQPLAERLQKGVKANSNEDVLSASLSILNWGKVDKPTKAGERPSIQWLKEAAKAGSLCSKIGSAVTLLKDGNFQRFDGATLIMDSGITKVISFADPEGQLIIYDGRVGSALAYLARLFLEERGYDHVPTDLRYGWGSARTRGVNRNPSAGKYSFPMLWSGSAKSREHARMMAMASKLIDRVRKLTTPTTSSRDWEAALFMIGYEVPRP